MRKQLITVIGSIAVVIFVFAAGTAIASHLSSHKPSTKPPANRFYGRFGRRGFPGGGFFGLPSGNAAIGRVTKISGNAITITSFRTGSESITVNSSTTYSQRASFGSPPSKASLSAVKSGSFILAQGSKSNGRFVAKSIIIMPSHRSGFGGFGNGPGQGYTPPPTSTVPGI